MKENHKRRLMEEYLTSGAHAEALKEHLISELSVFEMKHGKKPHPAMLQHVLLEMATEANVVIIEEMILPQDTCEDEVLDG